MTDERREQAAAEALGALHPAESTALQAEIAREPALARELAGYRTTVAILERSIARERPSHDLFAGILAEIQPDPGVESKRSWGVNLRWTRAWAGFAIGAAAAASVFALAFALGSDGPGTPDAVAVVQGTPAFPSVHGEARIYDTGTASGVLRLELGDLPPAPAGEHYEVWVLRPSAGEAMEAVGVFDPTSSQVSLELGLPGAGDYAAVDISVEPDAGSPEHSGTSLAGGEFESPTA